MELAVFGLILAAALVGALSVVFFIR